MEDGRNHAENVGADGDVDGDECQCRAGEYGKCAHVAVNLQTAFAPCAGNESDAKEHGLLYDEHKDSGNEK